MVRDRNVLTRRSVFRALARISSYHPDSKILVEAWILQIMIEEMFNHQTCDEALDSKVEAASIITNIIDLGIDLNTLQSYTASLTSMLTLRNIKTRVTTIASLWESGDIVGCDPNTFVCNNLVNALNFTGDQILNQTTRSTKVHSPVSSHQFPLCLIMFSVRCFDLGSATTSFLLVCLILDLLDASVKLASWCTSIPTFNTSSKSAQCLVMLSAG
ncbi:hypothetical protein MLD38_037392 [Melastoma candidum]|uniref:Uncharacterized protein n=1 Tax=Melastoma candidum TaxID=119954 RepID=A0ACB9LLX4_9MYRT|nr:hypothetical protein MLD38_037392 [Melastoma candidum]